MQANANPWQAVNRLDLDEKIVGGSPATIDSYPHLVSLHENGSYSCGGSILTETKILSAAHCFKLYPNMSGYTILAGSTYLTGDVNAQERRVSRGFHHPWHAAADGRGDVGILFLIEALTFALTIRPIRLPPQNGSVPYGVNAPMAGWGVTDNDDITALPNVLQHTHLLIIKNEECNRPSSYNGSVSVDQFCAGPMEGGHGICKGDSGSPLVVGGVQYGILTDYHECGLPNFPGVFVRVPFFSDWIRSIT